MLTSTCPCHRNYANSLLNNIPEASLNYGHYHKINLSDNLSFEGHGSNRKDAEREASIACIQHLNGENQIDYHTCDIENVQDGSRKRKRSDVVLN